MIYFTGPSGTFPATASEGQYPQSGLPNGLIGKNAAINVGHNAKNAAYDTPATWTLEMTNAAADNLTVFKIGGVSQISGPVAMVAGNLEASAALIAAAINATATALEWTCYAVNGVVYGSCVTKGITGNGLALTITFSGASTADITPVTGGGTDKGAYRTRVWLDTADSASATVKGAGAVDITAALAAMPNTPVEVVVAGLNQITLNRKESYADVMVSGLSLETITYNDAQEGDVIVLRGNTLAGVPTTVTNAGNIVTSTGVSVVLTDDEDSMVLTYLADFAAPGSYRWVETGFHPLTLAEIRDLGAFAPAYPGVDQVAIPAAGNYIIAPGGTGGGYDTNQAFVEFRGANVVLAGPVNIVLTHGLVGQDLIDGDSGIIYFMQTATAAGANFITITDTDGLVNQVIDNEMAATGKYAVVWSFDGTRFMASVIPNITSPGWIKTAMIGALQVTDAEIADLDGTKIQAGTIPFTAADAALQALIVGGNVYTVYLAISNAGVLTINATPIELVPTPGPGFRVRILQAACRVLYNTAAYVVGNLYLQTAGATQPQWSNNTVLQATVAREELFINQPAMGAADTQIISNAAVNVTAPAAPTIGDSDIIIKATYVIEPE
jgi:hypothetical protein